MFFFLYLENDLLIFKFFKVLPPQIGAYPEKEIPSKFGPYRSRLTRAANVLQY